MLLAACTSNSRVTVCIYIWQSGLMAACISDINVTGCLYIWHKCYWLPVYLTFVLLAACTSDSRVSGCLYTWQQWLPAYLYYWLPLYLTTVSLHMTVILPAASISDWLLFTWHQTRYKQLTPDINKKQFSGCCTSSPPHTPDRLQSPVHGSSNDNRYLTAIALSANSATCYLFVRSLRLMWDECIMINK